MVSYLWSANHGLFYKKMKITNKIRGIFKSKKIKKILLFFSFAFVFFLFLVGSLDLYFFKKIYPNTYASGVNIGGLTVTEAAALIQKEASLPETINLSGQTQNFEIKTTEIGAKYNYLKTAERAFNLDRTGNLSYDIINRLKSFFIKREIGISTSFNEDVLTLVIQNVSGSIFISPVYPSVKAVNSQIVIEAGSAGVDVDNQLLRALIGESLAKQKTDILLIVAYAIRMSTTFTDR